eukprot:scaffold10680_cov64-Attheya_sp.AAC.7
MQRNLRRDIDRAIEGSLQPFSDLKADFHNPQDAINIGSDEVMTARMRAMYIKAAQLVAYQLSSIVELSFWDFFFATVNASVNRKRREKTQTGNNFTVWLRHTYKIIILVHSLKIVRWSL